MCRSIALTKNGYLITGGTGDEIPVIYLSHIDSLGNLKWTQTYSKNLFFYYLGLSGSLSATFDRNYVIFGSRTDINNHSWGLIIKVDSAGNKIWEKNYDTVGLSHDVNSGFVTRDSGFIYTGAIWNGKMKSKYLLLKTNSLGDIQWYKTFTDNNPDRNYSGKCVVQTPDKGYCLGGWGIFVNSPNWKSIVEIIKTDSMGNQQWKKTYGNPLCCNSGAMLCLGQDSCILGTYNLGSTSLPEDNKQSYIVKIGMDGIEYWNKKIGIPAPANWISWVQTLYDGSFILSGGNRVKDTIFKAIGWLQKINKKW